MRLYSADVEISAPIFLKATSLKAVIAVIDAINGHQVRVEPNKIFSDRGYKDPKLRPLTFATTFTVQGLWHGKQLTDCGPTLPPKPLVEGEGSPVTGHRLYAATARIAEKIYIKAEDSTSAMQKIFEARGTRFKFPDKDDQFFGKPPLLREGVRDISFGRTFTLQLCLGNIKDRGKCPSWVGQKRRSQMSSLEDASKGVRPTRIFENGSCP